MDNKILQPKTGKFRLHEDVELPIDGLPQFLQEYINEIVRVYHCPREFPTVAVFSVIASAIGKRVKVTDHKYTNPLMLWFERCHQRFEQDPAGEGSAAPVA